MLWIFFLSLAATPVYTKVLKEKAVSCSINEFSCGDGGCISLHLRCDGSINCADGSDELTCDGLSNVTLEEPFPNRFKRQSGCRRNQWQCKDGTCISFDGKCDGMVDCPDRSDETFPLCRKTPCQSNWFRCTYGACVDGTAPCNNITECADNSDELLPQCRNEPDEVRGQFKCLDGSTISASNHCDGVADCPDGSDETVRACGGKACNSYLFQCAYGACVDQGADCNNKQECADGSDESDELCNRISPGTSTTKPTTKPVSSGACVLPQYPDHGKYTMKDVPNAMPGQAFEFAELKITCQTGYGVIGNDVTHCWGGTWIETMPKCVRLCRLRPHPSVEYRCSLATDETIVGTRPCNAFEPDGTQVEPTCRTNYYNSGYLSYMHCIDGSWDYVALCSPDCGKVTPDGAELVIGGWKAERGELPWHAGIYKKTTTPYMQICGGSLVSSTVVISAAHCFWNDIKKLLPASNYAVALGKIYRPWNNDKDTDAQKSDVSDLKIPPRFQGSATSFQDDIALVILAISIEYKTYVRPVCVNFDRNFEKRQLRVGSKGKVAGWGLTAENGEASQVLKVVELPYVDIQVCYSESPPAFRAYITSDKMCAGFQNGTALCRGDSGGGLAFSEYDRGEDRYYLRGIVSTAPNNENLCNSRTLTTFTLLSNHEGFIKEVL